MARRPTSRFLEDWLLYNSGCEVPANYSRFAILAMAGALMECRVYYSWTYGTFSPNLYVGLIGPQGLRKSSAASSARKVIEEVDPGHHFAASVISKERIIERLAQPAASKSFLDDDGHSVVYQPLTIIWSELKNAIAINPVVMVDFLTHVYDESPATGDTIKRKEEKVERPVVTMLACETTDWVIDKLRTALIRGGFSRRLVYVVEEDYPTRIAEPKVPKGGYEARARVVKKLKWLATARGISQFTPRAADWYKAWYEGQSRKDRDFEEAWARSRHVQLIKIAMILAAVEDAQLRMDVKHLEIAHSLLAGIEPRMFTLLAMSGRNPMLAPAYALTAELAKRGAIKEHEVRKMLFEWVQPREVEELLRHLQTTREISVGRDDKGVSLVRLTAAAQKKAQTRAGKLPASSPAD